MKVELLRAEIWEEVPLLYWSSSTQAEGIVSLPYLPPGRYEVRLAPEEKVEATLLLQIHNGPQLESTRSIVFEISLPAVVTLRDLPEATQTRAVLKTFTGTLEDMSGAVVAWSNVSIKNRDRPDGPDIAEAVTDQTGHFSISLPAGGYIAVFQSRGFLTEVVPFEIGPKGWDGLVLKLRIGGAPDYSRSTPYSKKGELSELGTQ